MDNHTRKKLDEVKGYMDFILTEDYRPSVNDDIFYDMKYAYGTNMDKFRAIYDFGYIDVKTYREVREELQEYYREKLRQIEERSNGYVRNRD